MSLATLCGVGPGMRMLAQDSRALERRRSRSRHQPVERRNDNTISHPRIYSANRLLADVRASAPDIAARVEEIETGRRIPPDLMESLKSIGVFRMLVPQSHGGLELDLPLALDIVTALAKIDGAV